MEDEKYYVIKKKAVPEVLLKVLEVQKLLDTRQAVSVMEAAENVGISRSSYYKYKDDIFPFYAKEKGKNITFVIEIKDQPGVMVSILEVFARYHANILTIHQSIPINGKGVDGQRGYCLRTDEYIGNDSAGGAAGVCLLC